MYPDLSYLLNDLVGTKLGYPYSVVKTYGVILALTIIVTAFLIKREIERMEKKGLLKPVHVSKHKKKFNLIPFILDKAIAFFIGYKLFFVVESGIGAKKEIWFSSKGSLLGGLLGVIVGIGLHLWKSRKDKVINSKEKYLLFPHERVYTIMLIAGITGLLGAKIIVLFENFSEFVKYPIHVWQNTGTAFYGALLGILAGVYFSCSIFRIPFKRFLDAGSCAAFFGYGIGRIGCHLSGDGDWGIANSVPVPEWWFLPESLWSYNFPHNIVNKGIQMDNCVGNYCHFLNPPVLPTSLYEFFIAFLLGFLILSLRKKFTIPGTVFALYLVFNGSERLLLEFIRVNKKFDIAGLSLSQVQIVAMVLIVTGLILFVKYKGTGKKPKRI